MPGPLGDFYRAGGQALLLRGAPIDAAGLVLDVGGYQGDFTAEVSWRFGARCLIVEPVPAFAAALRVRFAANARVRLLEAALGAGAGEVELELAADGTSAFGEKGGGTVRARMLDAAALVAAESPVALLKLNIEGAEFDVLDRLQASGLLPGIRSVLVQYHRVAGDSPARRDRQRTALSATHREVFCFPFVWERNAAVVMSFEG